MKIKTADLIGPALDWVVAQCESVEVEYINDGITRCLLRVSPFTSMYRPSVDWAIGGPLIEQECLAVRVFAEHGAPDGGPYWISERYPAVGHGPTPLIAGMRCYVESRLGDEVDVPDELV